VRIETVSTALYDTAKEVRPVNSAGRGLKQFEREEDGMAGLWVAALIVVIITWVLCYVIGSYFQRRKKRRQNETASHDRE
jgi:uncharacterized membrane protein